MAFTINTFVRAGELIPGGFTGLTLLIQALFMRRGIAMPFSVVFYILNAVPAVFCFKFVGKKFTLYSCLMILVSGLLTDWMPTFSFTSMIINAIQVHDILLSAVFGGILIAVSTAFCLYADATSGGTDFIAIFLSEKYRRDAWNYIFAGNCVILTASAFLFSPNVALYSIISQFATTMALSALYKNYQQKTMLIITEKPDEVCSLIWEITNHGATLLHGEGSYKKDRRVVVYSVVSATETTILINAIKKTDPHAFINVIKTDILNGHFNQRPKD